MEGSACGGGRLHDSQEETSLTAVTHPSLDELARLWAVVGGTSSGSKEAAATLGCALRGALRSSRAKPHPGAAAVLQLLDRLLSQDDGERCPERRAERHTERDSGQPTDHSTARVVDAIGWQLFDGLVVHLPVSRHPSSRSHVARRSRATHSTAADFALAGQTSVAGPRSQAGRATGMVVRCARVATLRCVCVCVCVCAAFPPPPPIPQNG